MDKPMASTIHPKAKPADQFLRETAAVHCAGGAVRADHQDADLIQSYA